MKPSARLINTSRGPIVDERVLIEVLRNRRIAGAALDVFDVEPLPPDHPCRSLDNVLATPHIGYVARELYRTFYGDTVKISSDGWSSRPMKEGDRSQSQTIQERNKASSRGLRTPVQQARLLRRSATGRPNTSAQCTHRSGRGPVQPRQEPAADAEIRARGARGRWRPGDAPWAVLRIWRTHELDCG